MSVPDPEKLMMDGMALPYVLVGDEVTDYSILPSDKAQHFQLCRYISSDHIYLWKRASSAFMRPHLYIFHPCHSSSYNYYSMYHFVRFKYIAMEEILVQAALREVDKIRIIRDYHAHTGAFQLGELIFYIRRRLERMIFIYQRCLRLQALHFEILREMHIVYMEIDHLMEMLEEFDIYDRDNPTESSVGGGAIDNMPGMPPGMHPGMPGMPHRGARRTQTSAPSAVEPVKNTVNKDGEANNFRNRQMAYLERKMILRNMARGLGNTTSPRKKKNKLDYEDGFESDKL